MPESPDPDSLVTQPRLSESEFSSSTPGAAKITGALALVVAVIGVLTWYWPTDPPPPVEPGPAASAAPVEPSPAPDSTDTETASPVIEAIDIAPVAAASEPVKTQAVQLPELQESDPFIRAELESWDLPERATSQDDLLARATVLFANAADGKLPKRLLAPFAPAEKFAVYEIDDQFTLNLDSYARYDTYVSLLDNIPPNEAAAFLHLIDPLLRQALAQLGERRAPAALILKATQRLYSLPELPDDIALTRAGANFAYADANLEALPAFEKQLLRFGPANLQKLRIWFSSFADAYGIEVAKLSHAPASQ